MSIFQYISLALQQQEEAVNQIKEKIANAPDSSYETGVVIATYLPFVLLVVFAYGTFYFVRKERNKEQ
jgi:hypothetical protein